MHGSQLKNLLKGRKFELSVSFFFLFKDLCSQVLEVWASWHLTAGRRRGKILSRPMALAELMSPKNKIKKQGDEGGYFTARIGKKAPKSERSNKPFLAGWRGQFFTSLTNKKNGQNGFKNLFPPFSYWNNKGRWPDLFWKRELPLVTLLWNSGYNLFDSQIWTLEKK